MMEDRQFKLQFMEMFEKVGGQMLGLSTTVGAQGVAKVIPCFDGECKQFNEWIKSEEKNSRLVGVDDKSISLVAYQSSKGYVSDYLRRYLDANPDKSWQEVKANLTARFAEVGDPQHALLLLRRVKQTPHGTIKVFAERLIAIGDDAFEGQPAAAKDRQLIVYFIDGLFFDNLKMKIMGDNPATL